MPKTQNYILRDIPQPLWDAAKHKQIDEHITLRELLLKALEQYLTPAGETAK